MIFNKNCSLNYKNETKFLTMLNAAHLFHLSIIIFNTNPKNIDHIFTSWHEFKIP